MTDDNEPTIVEIGTTDRPDDPTGERPTGGRPPTDHRIVIRIDRREYTVPPDLLTNGMMTGAAIRRLADPDIGDDRDLFEVVPGGSDRKIEDDEEVQVHNGLRFFSAPRRINPGVARLVVPTQRMDHRHDVQLTGAQSHVAG